MKINFKGFIKFHGANLLKKIALLNQKSTDNHSK